MRILLCLALALAACHPTAAVERTMPVASLQSYRSLGLRVHTAVFASQGMAMFLEKAVIEKVRAQCGFEQVDRAGPAPADVVLDLDITKMGRGGGGWISNANLAKMDTLLVLTDGREGDLLGTARIHGESSGVSITGNASPETEAIDIVAKTIADLLAKSGCAGPRVARVEPPKPPVVVPDPTKPTVAEPDAATRAKAEALNEQGKEKLYGADTAGAVAAFQQANTIAPDPRYVYNVCLAYGAAEQWDPAIAACRQAQAMNPPPALAAKIEQRVGSLQHHQ